MNPVKIPAINKMAINQVYLLDYDTEASSIEVPMDLIQHFGVNELYPMLSQQDKDLIATTNEVYSDKKCIFYYYLINLLY